MEKRIIRKISFIVIFSMIVSLIPVKSTFAIDDMNVISDTTISKNIAKEYMRSKGATEEFVGLADLYWKYSASNGNVNPALAYVQSAKETGYGKFGGVINASYHNPCGLKTSKGGADNDPNAHQKFNNWDEGVQAHLDHLALYAGASGYPRKNTYDPRHFDSIKGKAPTVLKLGGAWAPSAEYGQDLMNMYKSLQAYNDAKSEPITKIETPSNGLNVGPGVSSIDIKGWAINKSGIKEVKVYIDGKYDKNAEIGLERKDIGQKYPNYLESNKSGFKANVDLSGKKAGVVNVKIVQYGKDGTTNSTEANINYIKRKPVTVIEAPKNGCEIIEENKDITISGWAINDSGTNRIEVYVDGKHVGNATRGFERKDIGKAYPEYKGSSHSGYTMKLSLKDFKAGVRYIKVIQYGNDGSSDIKEVAINYSKPKPKTIIETPTNGSSFESSNSTLKVSGWAINYQGVKEIKTYVNGKYAGNAEIGFERKDIGKAYKNYENSNNSGYVAKLNLNQFKAGKNNIKIIQYGKDGSENSVDVDVNIKKLEPKTGIDSFGNGYSLGPNQYNLKLSGWAINDSGIKEVKVYVDGKFVGNADKGFRREDIGKAYPKYKYSDKSGYTFNIDLKPFKPGVKNIKVMQVGNDGSENIKDVNINFYKKSSITKIESPYDNVNINGDYIDVSGWAINDSGIKEVKVYLNDAYLGKADTGFKRDDIFSIYSNYIGSRNSGYKYKVSTDKLKPGINTVTIKAYGNDGSVDTVKKSFGRKKVVAIDPGHTLNGGVDTGSISYHDGIKYDEGKLDMELSMKLKNSLESKGYSVVMTQTLNDLIYATTVIDSLKKRVDVAELYDADLFVSIHHNNYDSSSAYGTEVWYSNPKDSSISPIYGSAKESEKIASKLATSISESGGFYNRGSKNGRLYVTRMTTMPSVLVEAGFLSNKSDAKKAADSNNQKRVSNGLANAIDNWFKSN